MAHRMPGMAAATSNDLQVQWDFAQAVEKEIRTQLKKKDNPPSYDRIEALVAEYVLCALTFNYPSCTHCRIMG